MTLNGLICAEMPLRNNSLSHALTEILRRFLWGLTTHHAPGTTVLGIALFYFLAIYSTALCAQPQSWGLNLFISVCTSWQCQNFCLLTHQAILPSLSEILISYQLHQCHNFCRSFTVVCFIIQFSVANNIRDFTNN